MRTPAGRLTATFLLTVVLGACSSGTPGDDGAMSSPGPATETTAPGAAQPTTSPEASPTPAEPAPSPEPTREAAPDPETAYADPDELSEVLVAAETAIRDPEVVGAELSAWAWVQQAVYRQLAATPEWHDPVLERVPGELAEAARLNLRATVELRELTAPREELPPWRIIPPPPPEELLDAYREAADEFGIDWTYLAAIHLVESRMGRIRGDSTAGAKGPMQFLPATWRAYGEGDIDDPHDAIRAAARYLEDHGAPGDMDAAIWAYNHSDRYVTAVKDHAAVMREDERAYHAYHAWRVYYRLASGDVVLDVGYDGT